MHTLEKRLNYTFENKELLERALYHSSYANEHRGWSFWATPCSAW